MTLNCVSFDPFFVVPLGSVVGENNARLAPSNSPFFAILVSERKLSLSPHKLLVEVELAPVAPVVEDGVLCGMIPLPEVE